MIFHWLIIKCRHKFYTLILCHDTIHVQYFLTLGSSIMHMFISYLSHSHVGSILMLLSTLFGPWVWDWNLEFCTRYTAENSVKYGAPRNTDHPELRQPLALEVWESVVETLDPGSKITILTNGPLTNLAKIIQTKKNTTSFIQVSGFYLLVNLLCKLNLKKNWKVDEQSKDYDPTIMMDVNLLLRFKENYHTKSLQKYI